MTVKDFIDLGIKSDRTIRFNKDFSELEYDTFAECGMIAKVVACVETDHDCIKLKLDFSVAREHNLSLATHNFFLMKSRADGSEHRQTGTALEAGLIGENLIEEIYFDPEIDLFDIVGLDDENDPLGHYLKKKEKDPDMKLTYLEWLEAAYRASKTDKKIGNCTRRK